MSGLKDMKGTEFYEGCRFIKPTTSGRSAFLEVRVASIRNGKLYGDASKVPIQHPRRSYILEPK
jgi:hypothetical protein